MANLLVPRAVLVVLLSILASCSPVEDPSLYPVFDAEKAVAPPPKPMVIENPNRNAFWGDLHIHTSFSTDAYIMGVRTLPDDAYTFAKGGEIEHAAGYGIRIDRPLDFAAVTDHSEFLGAMRSLKPDVPLSARSLRTRLLNDSPVRNTIAFLRTFIGFKPGNLDVPNADAIARDGWQQIIDAAESHNDPGRFTSFIGYEWSGTPDNRNLHRNVIYRGSKVPEVPYSSVDSKDPRDLWTVLEQQREQGMQNFAIPHNGNLSDGRMYDSVAFDGTRFDASYADRRMRNEPLTEMFQIKGSSETNPVLSPDDEFAGFEIYDKKLFTMEQGKSKGSYIRDALRIGIEFSHNEGFNPYRFGVVSGTDSHNASAPAAENNYHGKLPLIDGSAGIRLGKSMLMPEERRMAQKWSAQGLTAVWAEKNTRDSLFDAMLRKETYATSGPRITVRFFGGWQYSAGDIQNPDFIDIGYRNGVPMGGTLPVQSAAAPSFAVMAIKDSESGNLDRIQIIKGWVDASGKSHERIYNVALSDGRKVDQATGKAPAVGNTVKVDDATYSNSIGAQQLGVVWTDPNFDADSEAFYYTRVIEIPTPRWSTYDAVKLGIDPPEPVSIQERAVTSAIWYNPPRQHVDTRATEHSEG